MYAIQTRMLISLNWLIPIREQFLAMRCVSCVMASETRFLLVVVDGSSTDLLSPWALEIELSAFCFITAFAFRLGVRYIQ